MIPGLKSKPQEIGEILTMTGLMMDEFEEVKYEGKKDYLMGFEVRQNRPDCLSFMGIVREVAAYYGLKIKNPEIVKNKFQGKNIKININEKKNVKRLVAIEMEAIKNSKSPDWLKDILIFCGVNSVNLLVDLSNYSMLMTGQPSHIFDKDEIKGDLSWCLNKKYNKIVTLDGSEVKINKEALIIKDDKNILALAGIVGGDRAKIKESTSSVIIEMAIYDYAIINKNARKFNISTEAGLRLSKDLDPNSLDFSIEFLVSLIKKYCEGRVTSKLFNYYPQKRKIKPILFDPSLPTIFGGVEISDNKSKNILENLGCNIQKKGKKFLVTPPINRTDLNIEEDIIEEVIRIFGFYNIPNDEIPLLGIVKNITPKSFYLQEKIKNILQYNGYDEILSLPLVSEENNSLTNYKKEKAAVVQNSINEDFPQLRQSIAASLILQLKNYLKLKVEDINIFEIGKIFKKRGKQYLENDSLGILINSNKKEISTIKKQIENILRSLGLSDISYSLSKNKPLIANPFSVFDIIVNNKTIGILYKINIKETKNSYFTEINLDKISVLLKDNKATFEMTRKIVTLDANIELEKESSIFNHLKEIRKKINSKNLLSIKIVDVFPLQKNKLRYTARVSYKELSDQEAKKIHLNIFNLK